MNTNTGTKTPKPTIWQGNNLLEAEELREALKGGANPNRKNREGYHAMDCGSPEQLMLLLDFGWDPNIVPSQDEYSRQDTALHIWAKKNEFGLCKRLIEAGANIEATNLLNQTPLHFAAKPANPWANMDVAELLIMNGANISVKDRYGETPLDIADKGGAPERAQFLLDTHKRYEAEQSKKALLEGLGTAWKPSDCKEERGAEQQQEERQRRQRKM